MNHTDIISLMLEQYALEKQGTIIQGWALRVLLKGGVPPAEIFDVYRQMYEPQVSNSSFFFFHRRLYFAVSAGPTIQQPSQRSICFKRYRNSFTRLRHPGTLPTIDYFQTRIFGLVDDTDDNYLRELLPSNIPTLRL